MQASQIFYYILSVAAISWIFIMGAKIAYEDENRKLQIEKMRPSEYLSLVIIPSLAIYALAWFCRLFL